MKFEILFIGGVKERIRISIDNLSKSGHFDNETRSTGYLNPCDLSNALISCSLGITPIPLHALGKSGSVAAFISHGIPVAAPVMHLGFSHLDVGFFSSELAKTVLTEPLLVQIKSAREAAYRVKEEIKVSTIAYQLILDLNVVSKHIKESENNS